MSGLAQVVYQDRGTRLTGRLVLPDGVPRAAIAVFPTIMNAAPNVLRRLPMLADAGFLAFLADFYGEEVPDRAVAHALGTALRKDVAHYRQRIAAGLECLAQLPQAQGLPRAAMGFCMGGQAVLEAARMGADLAAVVSFHGILSSDSPARPGDRIGTRMLICHGDRDPLVDRDQVRGFQQEMDPIDADYHLHVYARARHGFTDPEADSHGFDSLGYDPSADRQSWAAAVNFLDEAIVR